MLLKIDQKTISKWKASSVRSVFVKFVDGGCAGTKIEIETVRNGSWPETNAEISGVFVHFKEEDGNKLENSSITCMEKNGKQVWIYSGPSVKNRCGCGSSFGFSSIAGKIPSSHAKTGLSIEGIAKAKAKLSGFKG